MINKIQLLIGLFIFSISINSQAQNSIYTFSWKQDATLLGAGIGVFTAAYLYDQNLEILSETQINSLNPEDISGFDKNALNNFSQTAQDNSDFFKNVGLFLPITLMISKPIRNDFGNLALLFTETMMISGALTYSTKAFSRRTRPYTYNPEVPLEFKMTKSAKHSFFSGHVSLVATAGFFSAKVFSDYFPNSRWKPVIWTTAALVPAITGYLRVRSGRHFNSDVISGFIVGAGIGYLIPQLHKKDRKLKVAYNPLTNGPILTLKLN